MGFKDFCKNKNIDCEDSVKNETKKVEQLYDEYKDKSEDELTSELFKQVQKQKNDGTFDYDYLQGIAQKVSPFLNDQQNKKINDLLNQMKN